MEIECSLGANGTEYWHQKGNPRYYHRVDGPAGYNGQGQPVWWYLNKYYADPTTGPLELFLGYCQWMRNNIAQEQSNGE